MAVTVLSPTNISAYNEAMDGTDLFDQFGSYLRSNLRSRAWQLRIYTHFLLASAVNASILQNYGAAKKDGKFDSVIKLIEEWSGESLGCTENQDSSSEISDH